MQLKRFRHGCSSNGVKTKEYQCWQNLKGRCRNKNIPGYKNYGGRGITVCERWLDKENGFKNFIEDMGYSNGMSIDRIDNNKGYFKENCRWASTRTQSLNKRIRDRKLSRGVRISPKGNYISYIAVDGKYIHIGMFTTEKEASNAHEEYRKKIYTEEEEWPTQQNQIYD